MPLQLKLSFKSQREHNTIEIYSDNIPEDDSTLSIDGTALLDESNGVAFVLQMDFRRKYDLIYLIDGNVYRKKTGLPDTYGVINV